MNFPAQQNIFGDFAISFEIATVTNCDFIGRTVDGIQAVVRKNGTEVFRSAAHTKRSMPRAAALKFIEAAR